MQVFHYSVAAPDEAFLAGGPEKCNRCKHNVFFYRDQYGELDHLNAKVLPIDAVPGCELRTVTQTVINTPVFDGLFLQSAIMLFASRTTGNVCFQSLDIQDPFTAKTEEPLAIAVAVQPNSTAGVNITTSTLYWRPVNDTSTILFGRFERIASSIRALNSTKVQLHPQAVQLLQTVEAAFTWSRVSSGCFVEPFCDDKIDCTVDTCEVTTRVCRFTPDNTRCDDGYDFTSDVCVVGSGCRNDQITNAAASSGDSSSAREDGTLGIVLGIVIPVVVLAMVLGVAFLMFRRRRMSDGSEAEMESMLFGGVTVLTDVDVGQAIGEGAFGAVFLADWRGTKVACKSLTKADDSVLEEASREAKTLNKLNHPGIVNLLGLHYNDGPDAAPLLVFEFCENGSVLQYLEKLDGKPELELLFELFHNLVVALVYLHGESVVHNDIGKCEFDAWK
jgi:Protein tyrosine and serine/threonine kinase